jgi:hypothetical protein
VAVNGSSDAVSAPWKYKTMRPGHPVCFHDDPIRREGEHQEANHEMGRTGKKKKRGQKKMEMMENRFILGK